ncbi:LON peptidase N-terminal domain and RING finger protein 2 [Scleropages formosus]|uniref:LON peptidase N-terminal domain and ring finger 2 n=1 Tax=Scleropages formosus TaxID=113540 RepID=A0A8C9R1K6_SCLFO|nr:LON peptidase N-terminal domain and RING finger protein 2 [Scleropages formosus]
METDTQRHAGSFPRHALSNPAAAGLCPEMLEVAEEASRAGNFELAADIYGSQLAELQQPDRGLCLRRADALVRAGRLPDALDSYCAAARLHALRPEELALLVESIARTLRHKEPPPPPAACAEDEAPALDLFSCRMCAALLSEPATLRCGHTFCKRCLEGDEGRGGAGGCGRCAECAQEGRAPPGGFRVNVVLSALLEKWFEAESRARRFCMEGERMWRKRELPAALDKFNRAAELAPSDCRLITQRAELLIDMQNYSQAAKDADGACRLRPHLPQVHYLKATALSKAGHNEEALQEYFLCVALKPDWTAVKTEAQKMLSEMFSSLFERDALPTSLHPHQSGPSATRLKPPLLLGSVQHVPHGAERQEAGTSKDSVFSATKNAPPSPREGPAQLLPSLSKGEPPLGEGKTLVSVLSSAPGSALGLKRKSPGDVPGFAPPTKLLRHQEGASSSQSPPTPVGSWVVPPELLDSADMECSLCMRLFYEPVATPCGHTFCLKCLERCLDHTPSCPLCKENLSEYLATRGYNKTLLMEEVLLRYLSDELAERKKIHEEEMKELSNLNQEVPIFVCTMAFPTIPCPLHVFEPRYRLMIRRSMETGTKQFGMCIADELKGFADFGCMLQVRDVKFFPDGRSVVDTIGVARFKVLSHGQRDGYNTAKIEYLEDRKVEGEELVELLKLHDSVYERATAWFTSLKDNMRNQILSHFGDLPNKDPDPQSSSSGPAWCWWLLAVLPLENRAQLSILAMTSLKDRLLSIRRVLVYVTRKRAR